MFKRNISPHYRVLGISLAALAAMVIAGCSSSSSASPGSQSTGKSGARGDTLTIGTFIPNGSLDPAKANPGTDPIYLDPLYAPLIRVGSNGQLQGVLASSWQYVGTNYETFQITLRAGVEFSNGTPVTGAAVVASINHYKSGTNGGQWLVNCPSVTAPSTTTVEIQCTKPAPELAKTFSDLLIGGDIVAPASLDNPSTLGTNPIGAGEYTLDTSQTVAGSSYAFLANPKYFDQSAIHWNRMVVKFFPTSSAGLAALRSGQINQFFTADTATLEAAKASGVKMSLAPLVFEGVELADRTPGAGNPIGNLKVRQALEYAVDRAAIVKAVMGPFASPTDQVAIPTQPTAWNAADNDYYPYDPAKAKSLLAEAGYPNGFTINVETRAQQATMTQAVIGYWNKIGVKANLTTDTTIPGWISNALSKKFPVLGYGYGGLPMSLQAINWFEPIANPYNPFATSDPQILSLIDAASQAPPAQQEAAFQQVQDAGIKDAWYVGVAVVDAGYLDADNISAPPTVSGYQGNDNDVTPAS